MSDNHLKNASSYFLLGVCVFALIGGSYELYKSVNAKPEHVYLKETSGLIEHKAVNQIQKHIEEIQPHKTSKKVAKIQTEIKTQNSVVKNGQNHLIDNYSKNFEKIIFGSIFYVPKHNLGFSNMINDIYTCRVQAVHSYIKNSNHDIAYNQYKNCISNYGNIVSSKQAENNANHGHDTVFVIFTLVSVKQKTGLPFMSHIEPYNKGISNYRFSYNGKFEFPSHLVTNNHFYYNSADHQDDNVCKSSNGSVFPLFSPLYAMMFSNHGDDNARCE